MFIKDLTPGQQFTTAQSRGTVYTLVRVQCGEGHAVVDYTDGTGYAGRFRTRPLSTCTVVD